MSRKYDLAILVVLYNKKIEQSKTVSSILSLDGSIKDAHITLWNNGPSLLENTKTEGLNDKGFDVSIKETVNNISLSRIYNEFIGDIDANKYVILDDDSELSKEYFLEMASCDKNELGIPVIYSHDKVRSPLLNYTAIETLSNKTLSNKDILIAIGSGMVIGKEISNEMKQNFGSVFDERFCFYGVDATFCKRIKMANLNHRIRIISGFNHSLSRLENESKNVKDFRSKERAYDKALQIIYYTTPVKKLPLFIFTVLNEIIYRVKRKNKSISLVNLVKAILSGKHYRSDY